MSMCLAVHPDLPGDLFPPRCIKLHGHTGQHHSTYFSGERIAWTDDEVTL